MQLILNTEITKVINIYIHTGIVFMKADCSTNVQLFIHKYIRTGICEQKYIFYSKTFLRLRMRCKHTHTHTSPACCLRSATCAAITRCLSSTSTQLAHRHSRQRHVRLWPLRRDTTPWFRQRAHFGLRTGALCAPGVLCTSVPSKGPSSVRCCS